MVDRVGGKFWNKEKQNALNNGGRGTPGKSGVYRCRYTSGGHDNAARPPTIFGQLVHINGIYANVRGDSREYSRPIDGLSCPMSSGGIRMPRGLRSWYIRLLPR